MMTRHILLGMPLAALLFGASGFAFGAYSKLPFDAVEKYTLSAGLAAFYSVLLRVRPWEHQRTTDTLLRLGFGIVLALGICYGLVAIVPPALLRSLDRVSPALFCGAVGALFGLLTGIRPAEIRKVETAVVPAETAPPKEPQVP